MKRYVPILALIFAVPFTALAAVAPQPDIEPLSRFLNIRIGDIIMIVAVLLAPMTALWVQWRLQLRHEARNQRMVIFKTLMATRATSLDVNHVQALNMIDVEFATSSLEDQEIRGAWKNYLAYLNTDQPQDPTGSQQWGMKRLDVLATLLEKIGKQLGYKFDFVDYKDKVYHPTGLADNWNEMVEIRRGWLAVLKGQQSLNMAITSIPTPTPPPQQPPTIPARR